MQDQEIKQRSFQTQINKYGGIGFASPITSIKIKQANLKKYGTENPLDSKEIQEKIKQNNIKKYGVANWMQSDANDGSQAFQRKEYTLPSGRVILVQGFEPYALDYLFNVQNRSETDFLFGSEMNKKVRIMYELNGIEHRYYPDAFDVANNTAIEVKSTYTLNGRFATTTELEAKKQATLGAGFNYRLMVMENFKCTYDKSTASR